MLHFLEQVQEIIQRSKKEKSRVELHEIIIIIFLPIGVKLIDYGIHNDNYLKYMGTLIIGSIFIVALILWTKKEGLLPKLPMKTQFKDLHKKTLISTQDTFKNIEIQSSKEANEESINSEETMRSEKLDTYKLILYRLKRKCKEKNNEEIWIRHSDIIDSFNEEIRNNIYKELKNNLYLISERKFGEYKYYYIDCKKIIEDIE